MAYSISAPRFSFIQFNETGLIEACKMPDRYFCLPVYERHDVWFQFVLTADTEEEADALCGVNADEIRIGLARNCEGDIEVDFTEAGYKADRYRISPLKVLYNWTEGLPGFDVAFSVGDCFLIKVEIDDLVFCSNCLQRIPEDCYTTVIEYGNEENGFGFNYCADSNAGDAGGGGETETCSPLVIAFTNQEIMDIPYTADLIAKYGPVPDVKVWIYNEMGDLQNMSVGITFDGVPPTLIHIDFGGLANGVVKIL